MVPRAAAQWPPAFGGFSSGGGLNVNNDNNDNNGVAFFVPLVAAGGDSSLERVYWAGVPLEATCPPAVLLVQLSISLPIATK